jgi:hypothetical protein
VKSRGIREFGDNLRCYKEHFRRTDENTGQFIVKIEPLHTKIVT